MLIWPDILLGLGCTTTHDRRWIFLQTSIPEDNAAHPSGPPSLSRTQDLLHVPGDIILALSTCREPYMTVFATNLIRSGKTESNAASISGLFWNKDPTFSSSL